ncbi:3-deoxy-manno-octulosonate cytidylyltransferase [Deferribacterales bacterium RsTz2092]|nr:3-deoxy-manno-octulosonate cytidylyltransferase [Deferribacterales bacterium]
MSAVIIPARYASTRFPAKIVARIEGIPMIARVAEQCKQSRADVVCIATDNNEVIKATAHLAIRSVMTPSDIATGTDRIAYAAKDINEDIIINVQGDEPFIPPALINELIETLETNPRLNMATACVPFENDADANNPAHVKVVLDANDYALYFSRLPLPADRDGNVHPIRYRHIGIYGYRRDFLLKYAHLPATPLESAERLEQLRALENGERIKVIKTHYSPISVDTPEDFATAESYARQLATVQ